MLDVETLVRVYTHTHTHTGSNLIDNNKISLRKLGFIKVLKNRDRK